MCGSRPYPTARFLVVLVAGLMLATLVGGCGPDENKVEAVENYNLDPPELGIQDVARPADGIPVICYHYFRSNFDGSYVLKVLGSVLFGMPALGPREFWTTPIGEFEKHLAYFQETGTRVLTLDEVADMVVADLPLPDRAVVLTIDDADESVYELAYPMLKKYDMKAHLFVPTAHVGYEWTELKVCDWEQLREMSDSGHIIIDSHTRDLHYKVKTDQGLLPVFYVPDRIPEKTHDRDWQDLEAVWNREGSWERNRDLVNLMNGEYGQVAANLIASRMDIETGVGRPSGWLAWPYGFAPPDLESVALGSGFRGTVSLKATTVTEADSNLQFGRFTLTAKTTLDQIRMVFPR